MGASDRQAVVDVYSCLADLRPLASNDAMYRPDPVRPEIAFDVLYGLGDHEVVLPLMLSAWPEGDRWFYEVRGWVDSTTGWKTVWPPRVMCTAPKLRPDLYAAVRLLTVAIRELERQRGAFITQPRFSSDRRLYAAKVVDERMAQLKEAVEALKQMWAEEGDGTLLPP